MNGAEKFPFEFMGKNERSRIKFTHNGRLKEWQWHYYKSAICASFVTVVQLCKMGI
jgi:hypothetical protein